MALVKYPGWGAPARSVEKGVAYGCTFQQY